MKILLAILTISFALSSTTHANSLQEDAAAVPTQAIDQEVAGYLANELGYTGSFKSDYTLAQFKDLEYGDVWHILDGYYTLPDNTILFLDFAYNPKLKFWRPINNYAFVPAENKRFLLKAEETCNPYKRHFIGVVVFNFREPGHLDDMMLFFKQELKGSPILYSNGASHMVQDLTQDFGAKPLFTLHEEELVKKMAKLPFVYKALLIPSGRLPSGDKISQTYVGVTEGCKNKETRFK